VDSIIVFLLILTTILIVVKVIFLWWIFGPDIKLLRGELKQTSAEPECVYCRSQWTHPTSDGEMRWEGDDLVLVTTYQCEHCELPFWHVERVSVVAQRG
jgi:hypothetical protein